MKTIIYNKIKKLATIHFCLLALGLLTVSCSDFFDVDSDHVAYIKNHEINTAGDTIYSVTGILNQVQRLADRTILLGEVRADLVDVTANVHRDLKDIALFTDKEDNPYNNPRDYYNVINNCNYFITHVADSLKNNRNKYIFLNEIVAVKAIRAWTYLQLALNYGEVPFFTEPLVTKELSDAEYPRKGVKEICQFFIDDLKPYANDEKVGFPGYGNIKEMDSRLFFFPLNVVLGDLNLWAGNYKDAARCYYRYIATRNGMNSAYPTGMNAATWSQTATDWTNYDVQTRSWIEQFSDESYGANSELITMIPGNENSAEGFSTDLPRLFGNGQAATSVPSLVPSQGVEELSAAQTYCFQPTTGDVVYVPHNLTGILNGDLRLRASTLQMGDELRCNKNATSNIHIYRRTMVYARLAEAMNASGYPRFAFAILSSGLNNTVLENEVIPYYRADSTFLREFNFPVKDYVLATKFNNQGENTMGIHSRGCGFTPSNIFYQMPDDETITDSLQRIAYQQKAVETMLLDEDGLEFAFEGTRWYDLMRFALRAGDPTILSSRVYGRRGMANAGSMKAIIGRDINNPQNWYLPTEW